jgi:small GTP-binding protein
VVVVGQYAVGKSSIIKQLTDQQFSDGQVATIGVEFREKVIDDVNLQIWDIAGQQRASFLVTQYYRHALCAVIVADVTKMGMQYQHETIQWRDDVLQKATPPPGYQLDDGQLPLFIVFNKIDLLPAGPERDNVMQHWREFASDHGFTRAYFTSAKDYASVLEVFRNVADVVAKIPQLRVDTTRRPADILGRNQNGSGSPPGAKSGDKCPC